ncbi:hypothetical protein MKX01_020645, partial [Papaver californicum]
FTSNAMFNSHFSLSNFQRKIKRLTSFKLKSWIYHHPRNLYHFTREEFAVGS